MHLISIRIAGFKSFADPVTIHIPKTLSGVVGPNGSGKSNVIDAMRWVVGESSAKSLRGGTLDDVIFNGSAQRKPAGQASVELLFDNSLSRCGGQWEKYAEISIRRTVTRDGVSEYFINNTRARRRDVKELFLGTGFGPRSYSIIEQGMISRIVDGKPEDLSAFIEEASGVSRFREKRHETQLKMNRVEENLKRLDDMRSEVEKRIRQLKYQSDQARRYRKQKEKLNALRIQLLTYEWRQLSQQVEQIQVAKAELDTTLEQRTAGVRTVEADLEGIRQRRLELESQLTDVQMELFRINAEIADCDRRIKESREQLEGARTELQTLEKSIQDTESAMVEHQQQANDADAKFNRIRTQTEALQSRLQTEHKKLLDEEAQLTELQGEAEQLEQRVIAQVRSRESVSATLEHKQRSTASVLQDLDTVNGEIDRLDAVVSEQIDETSNQLVEQAATACESLRSQISLKESSLAQRRIKADQLAVELDSLREHAREAQVQLRTLERSLAASTTESDEGFAKWLAAYQLDDATPLYASIEVSPDWDRAVDRVLGEKLAAVCVADLPEIGRAIAAKKFSKPHYFVATDESAPGVRPNSLSRFISSPNQIAESLLDGVYTTESVAAAMTTRDQLAAHECMVTAQGAMIGPNWYSPAIGDDEPSGMLETANLVRELQKKVDELDSLETNKKTEIAQTRTAVADLERELGENRNQLKVNVDSLEQIRAEQNASEVKRLQSIARLHELDGQKRQLQESLGSLENEFETLTQDCQSETDALANAERQRAEHAQRVKVQSQAVRSLQQSVNDEIHQCHSLELEAQQANANRQLANSALTDLRQRRKELAAQISVCQAKLATTGDPTEELQAKLAQFVEQRKAVEQQLATVRNQIETAESSRRQFDEQRLQHQLGVEETNLKLQEQIAQLGRLSAQSEEIKQKLTNEKADADAQVANLDAHFDYDEAYQKFEKLKRRIDNAGPVNLVAVDQYEQERKRKSYMDDQYEDLTRALDTLQRTMHKIDKESRERYVETFSVVNSEFQRLLPKLFGGGSGHLELTGDYPENSGMRIYARPKGKRIHNIQALSGGEKALTAVALILSFFQLNPSPVCLLDEIDAPLDDDNILRLCDSLHALSNTTQLILITHNKITMESVDTLIGVTMPEPNVSKILSVDLLEAQEFAA